MQFHNIQPGNPPPSKHGATIGLGATAATIISSLSDTAIFADNPFIHAALLGATIIVTLWCHRAESEGLRILLRESLTEVHHEYTTARISAYREKFQVARRCHKQRPGKH